jgi:hypothetical protein
MSKIEWPQWSETLSASEIDKLLTTQLFGLPNLEQEQAAVLAQLQGDLHSLTTDTLNLNWAEAPFLDLPHQAKVAVAKIIPELKDIARLKDPLELLRARQNLGLAAVMEFAPALMLGIKRVLNSPNQDILPEVKKEYEVAYKIISFLTQGGSRAEQLFTLLDQGSLVNVSAEQAQADLESLKLQAIVRRLKEVLNHADVFDKDKKELAKTQLSSEAFDEFSTLTDRMSLRLIVTEHYFYQGLIKNTLKTEDRTKAQKWLNDLENYSETGWLAKMSECCFDLLTLTSQTDYYQVLGLHNRESTPKEIKAAYRKKALLHHPDQMPLNDPSGTHFFKTLFEEMSIFELIQKAYEVLSDETARRNYDFSRSARTVPASSYAAPSSETRFGKNRPPGQASPSPAESTQKNREARPAAPQSTLSEAELYGPLENIPKKEKAAIIARLDELKSATGILNLLTAIKDLNRTYGRYKLEERKVDVIRDQIIRWGDVVETLEFLTYRNRIDHKNNSELFKSYLFKLPRIHGLWRVVEQDLIKKDHQIQDGFYSAMLEQVKLSDVAGGHNRIKDYLAGTL